MGDSKGERGTRKKVLKRWGHAEARPEPNTGCDIREPPQKL